MNIICYSLWTYSCYTLYTLIVVNDDKIFLMHPVNETIFHINFSSALRTWGCVSYPVSSAWWLLLATVNLKVFMVPKVTEEIVGSLGYLGDLGNLGNLDLEVQKVSVDTTVLLPQYTISDQTPDIFPAPSSWTGRWIYYVAIILQSASNLPTSHFTWLSVSAGPP